MNNDLKKLYIIGAGGFGREVAWLVERINKRVPTWELKGFVDDDEALWNTKVNGYKVFGGRSYLENQKEELWTVFAVANAKVRQEGVGKLSLFKHIHYAVLIDPSVALSEFVSIGEGSIICAGTIITVNIDIGKHNIINLGCTIGHDVILEDFVTLYPSVNVSGTVHIASATELGTGTQIIQGISIRSASIVGAGAVVVRDITVSGTYVGVPARAI